MVTYAHLSPSDNVVTAGAYTNVDITHFVTIIDVFLLLPLYPLLDALINHLIKKKKYNYDSIIFRIRDTRYIDDIKRKTDSDIALEKGIIP